ncbi:MAG: 50S ribosomal protein L25/general stress protein Ctc [Candidatus Omnitrophica bacterium]|nr:50S ribosomal protein L25/general stress protein Ctc [Candidatus Omnitrophota bacterium]
MKTVPLKANERNGVGKQQVKKIRSAKRIPAVVYGRGIKPTSIDVGVDDFSRAVHTKAGENVIIQLKVEGSKHFEKTVVIKEIQHHPVTDAIVHVDFNVISLTEKIKVKVPLHVKGEGDAPGLKEGGVLDVVHHEIEVECLPTQIPERLSLDITMLKIGDSLHIREIVFPEGVVSELPNDEVVVAIHAPKAEEEAAPAEEAPSEPELIAKEKKAEGEEAEAAAPAPAAAPEAKKEKPAEKKT